MSKFGTSQSVRRREDDVCLPVCLLDGVALHEPLVRNIASGQRYTLDVTLPGRSP